MTIARYAAAWGWQAAGTICRPSQTQCWGLLCAQLLAIIQYAGLTSVVVGILGSSTTRSWRTTKSAMKISDINRFMLTRAALMSQRFARGELGVDILVGDGRAPRAPLDGLRNDPLPKSGLRDTERGTSVPRRLGGTRGGGAS